MSFSKLPSFDELPEFNDFKGCAWDVWGKGDELGTVNLLTEEVIKLAANEEIKTGRTVCLNWPINFPSKPMYHRKNPEHKVLPLSFAPTVFDDEIHINTQSGTQWDGLRHVGIISAGVQYQGVPCSDIQGGQLNIDNPLDVDQKLVKLGIHNWAQHGICGRGVLIDLVKFFTDSGAKELPYDPWTSHTITVQDIQAAAAAQGVEFRQGDILILRIGFTQKFLSSTQVEREALGSTPETFAGIEPSLEMKRFLWDNHFAAIASDQPAVERWPPTEEFLHQTIIGLWGMPIGEFFDLEGLSKVAEEMGRYTFFFSSWPLNVLGGVASPANAAAFF